MQLRSTLALGAIVFACSASGQSIPLAVPAGVPLRLYLTKKISKKAGAPVEAKVLEPVYAFDHLVIPEGAQVLGQVTQVKAVSKADRTRAILGGDFTPLHTALIEFTTLALPDGRKMELHTVANPGLTTLVPAHPARSRQAPASPNGGVLGTGKQPVKDAIHQQIDRVKSIPDLVRGPDKKERVEDYLLAKLPYHPQYLRKGTRFDAELRAPLAFGAEPASPGSMALGAAQPAQGTVAHARLVTALDSRDSKQGQAVEAFLTEPVYSADHKLILPEGTRLEGAVTLSRRARWFRRSGQLRFHLEQYDLPAEAAALMDHEGPVTFVKEDPAPRAKTLQFRTQATLKSAEGANNALKVDSEGGVEVKQSKTRFLLAAASVLIARRAGDNDPIRSKSGVVIGQNANVAGRTIGGGFGFGLLGMGIAQSSRWVGAAFGYYGMAWGVYSTVIARGPEVRFEKNAAVEVRFDTRSPGPVAGR